LAREADIDDEEAILLLWDAGIESVVDPDDFVPRNWVSRARRAIGLHPSQLSHHSDVSSPDVQRNINGGPKTLKVGPTSEESPRYEWRVVGAEHDVIYINSGDVRNVHDALVRDFASSDDPISPPGIRDENLLDSAVFRPHTSYGDSLKYPTISMAGAALFHSLTLNHAFFNGNKRTALVSLLVFLESNEMVLEATEIELFRYVLRIANHRVVLSGSDQADREVLSIAEWIESRMSGISHGERPLRFFELRRILGSYDCSIRVLSGNRVLISREMLQRKWFRKGSFVLSSHIWYGGEGRDVERNTLQKVRRELWLDDVHGCDSSRFYAARPGIDEFISMYRRTLKRLARM